MAKYVIYDVAEINDINLSALYELEIQNNQVAGLLGVDKDEAESRAQDFTGDLRFAVDRELLIKLLK